MREQILFRQSAPFVEVLVTLKKNISKEIRKEKEKARAAVALDNRKTERTSRKCFRCGSKDHLIAKCPNPPKDNKKRQKQVRFNDKGNRARDNRKNTSDQ